MRIESMPVIGFSNLVPGPVGRLEVFKNDPGLWIFFLTVAPNVKIALAGTRFCSARALKPRVLVGRVVDDQLGNNADTAPMSLAQEKLEIMQRAVIGMDIRIVSDVIAVVF